MNEQQQKPMNEQQQKPITEASDVELKAIAFDLQNQLQIVIDELQKRQINNGR